MRTADLQDPVTYSPWVPGLGWAAVILVVAWIVGVLLATRTRPGDRAAGLAPVGLGGDPFATDRADHLARVDAVEQRFRAGELDLRGLHQELSAVVRDFATVRRGVDARVLTLSDLRRTHATEPVAGLIETYYRPAFAEQAHDASPRSALDGARWVISRW